MRMNAYYYSFDKTEVNKIDLILSAVAHAGKAFHHTDQWNEKIGYQIEDTTGSTPVEWIQNAANAAAKEFQRIPELEQRIRELEAERNAAIIRLSEQTMECGRLDANIERLEARESLLVAEVRRCWELANEGSERAYCPDCLANYDARPAEVRAIVEGKK